MRLKSGVNKHNMLPQGYTFPRFITKETQKKFSKIIKHRKFHQETGFPIIHDQPYYGLPKHLAETIDKHNWRTFVKHSANNNIYASIVQEFYSWILDPSQKYVLVRGFRVYFTPKYINFHYRLIKDLVFDDDIVDEYQDLKNTATEENLSSIMKTLTVEGTDWIKEKGKEIWKVSWEALKPIPKVWFKIICARLLPNSDFENVDRDRLLLLHCILEGRSINVGKILYDEIIDCAFKKKETDKLLFASLISDLCIRIGVYAEDDDDILINPEAIDLDSVQGFFKEEADKRERLEEDKSVRSLNPPEFPDEILHPFMTDDPTMHGQEKGKDPATGEAEDETFVHDNGNDLKEAEGREKERNGLSVAPSSQSSTRRFKIRVKTCPTASLMANKKKRCYVDLSSDKEGNEEEEEVEIKQVHPVVKYNKKRLKTTACRRRSCSKLELDIVPV